MSVLERGASLLRRFPGRAAFAVLGLSFALGLPSLNIGFFLDDHVHRYAMRGLPGPARGLHLFDFTPQDPAELAVFIRAGPYPWWTSPTLHMRFFRPLSSALSWVDWGLWREVAWAQHLHSLCWHLGVVAAGWLVLRRLLPGAAGPVALLLFAIAESHFLPAAWLSNRNALVAGACALLGLAAHLRWRRDGWAPGAVLSGLGLVGAVASAEVGVGFLVYPLALEWLGPQASWRQRLRGSAPALLVGAAYVVTYKLGGYGSRGSGVYLDPSAEPLAWLLAAPVRWLVLVGNALGNAPVDLWQPLPALQGFIVGESVLIVVLALFLLRRTWAGLAATERPVARALGVAALLALLPTVSTFPMARLVFPASLGAAAWLAWLVRDLFRRRARAWLAVVAVVHVLLPVVYWVTVADVYAGIAERANQVAHTMEVPRDWQGLRVVVLQSPDPGAFLITPLQRAVEVGTFPRTWWTLSMQEQDLRVTRTDERTLEVEPVGGRWLDTLYEQVVRTMATPFSVGDRVPLDGASVEVLAAQDGHPTRIRLQLDVPLESPGLLFLEWREGTFRRWTPPGPGASTLVRHQPGPMAPDALTSGR